ncbi:hypothetical protein HYT51_00830 [Candidatus Woesearchaeota archaeon]|nr:hypothetical protein [Candidatus Woesearchaeota archaeon]
MFDGGVDYKDGVISLVSKSNGLIKDSKSLLEQIGLSPDYISKNADKFGRFRIYIRKSSKLKRALVLFEKRTEKWHRLKEHIDGFSHYQEQNIETFIEEFEKKYPHKRKSAKTFSDYLKVIYRLKNPNAQIISKELQVSEKSVNGYLQKLKRWKIISKERKDLNSVWRLNSYLPIIRR